MYLELAQVRLNSVLRGQLDRSLRFVRIDFAVMAFSMTIVLPKIS
jgi:hypothetical protein